MNIIIAHMTNPAAIAPELNALPKALSLLRKPIIPPTTKAPPSTANAVIMKTSNFDLLDHAIRNTPGSEFTDIIFP
jgi:hypothetical protein